MIATAPPPVVNRIAGYVSAPPPAVPATPEGKQAAWGAALFAAALFYQSRLAHPDPEVAERAARAIFDLEKTRLRHGRDLAGATVEKPTTEMSAVLEPIPDLPPIDESFAHLSRTPNPEAVESADDAKDREKAEAFARTDAFATIVGKLRDGLIEKGIDDDEVDELATQFALEIVRERIRERRLAKEAVPKADPPPGGFPSPWK